jgi:hypothetical protein
LCCAIESLRNDLRLCSVSTIELAKRSTLRFNLELILLKPSRKVYGLRYSGITPHEGLENPRQRRLGSPILPPPEPLDTAFAIPR